MSAAPPRTKHRATTRLFSTAFAGYSRRSGKTEGQMLGFAAGKSPQVENRRSGL